MSFPTAIELIRSYKGDRENKSKIGQERSSMQQADYHRHQPTPQIQESVTMHKSPTPLRHSSMNQARSEEKEKERKRDRKDRGQEADGKKGRLNIPECSHLDTEEYPSICIHEYSLWYYVSILRKYCEFVPMQWFSFISIVLMISFFCFSSMLKYAGWNIENRPNYY